MKENRLLKVLLVIILCNSYSLLFGQEEYYTTSDGVKLYLNVKGEGTPCLFVHGGPGQGSNYWEKLSSDIGESNFKMIYLDQRGCGRSSSPKDSNYSIDRMIKDFEEIRVYLGISEWLIMGHSFGGILQTYYAQNYEERINGILTFNCTLDMNESLLHSYIPSVLNFFEIEDTRFFYDTSNSLSERLDSVQNLFTTRNDVWKLSFSTIESAIKFSETYSGFESWNRDFSKAAFSIEDYSKDYRIYTSLIQIPTLFLYTTKDNNVGKEHYKEIKFPNVMFVELDGGHMEFIDKKDDYLRAVNAFIEKFNIE